MFLLIPAHPGCPGQTPQSRKMVVCVCVCALVERHKYIWIRDNMLRLSSTVLPIPSSTVFIISSQCRNFITLCTGISFLNMNCDVTK